MKKNITLFVLFVLPLVAYLFFASGINSFSKLPVLTPHLTDLVNAKDINQEPVVLTNKITVLGFGGLDMLKNRGNLFNINMKIYERYHEFKNLQFVVLVPTEKKAEAEMIYKSLSAVCSPKEWKFVLMPTNEIKLFFDQLKLKKDKLNADFGTSKIYLIDKELNLRGRKVKDTKDYNEGYDSFHPSDLSNKMLDDFKILLYEYKAALKKNNEKLGSKSLN